MAQGSLGHLFPPPFLNFSGEIFHGERGLGFPDQVVNYILKGWFSRHKKPGEKRKRLADVVSE